MGNLSLVKSLSHLREEQKYTDEIVLDSVGLAFSRGSIAEISGEPSSGKTSLPLTLLSRLAAAGEICAVVDSANSFDPCSAVLAGVELENLLWIKCGGDIEKAFMSADLLVQAKGFGAVWLNLNGLPQKQLRMVPKTYWYRYRNRIKDTPTIFLVTAAEHVTGSASQRVFTFTRERAVWSGSGRYKLLREFHLRCGSQKGAGLRGANHSNENNYEHYSPIDGKVFSFLGGTGVPATHKPNGHNNFPVPQVGGTSVEQAWNKVEQTGTAQPFPRQMFGDALPIKIEFDYTDV